MSVEEQADPECEMEHLFGLAALDCIDDTVARRDGFVPVQRCDNCSSTWTDMDAAQAVGARYGSAVLVSEGQLWVKIGG